MIPFNKDKNGRTWHPSVLHINMSAGNFQEGVTTNSMTMTQWISNRRRENTYESTDAGDDDVIYIGMHQNPTARRVPEDIQYPLVEIIGGRARHTRQAIKKPTKRKKNVKNTAGYTPKISDFFRVVHN